MSSTTRTATTPREALVVALLCFGYQALSSMLAMEAGFPVRAFTDGRLVATVWFEILVAAIACAFLRWRGYALAALLPRPTLRGALAGLGLYGVVVVAGTAVIGLLANGRMVQPIDRMLGMAHLSLPVVLLASAVNGAFEEVFLLGFLARGLRGYGTSVALGASVLVRVLCHVYQGPVGAVYICVWGLVFGLYFLRTDRLWPVVFGHVLGDLIPFATRVGV